MANFDLDFHRPAQSRPVLGWLLVVTGLLGCAMAIHFTLEMEQLSEDVARLKSQLAINETSLRNRSMVVETPEQVSLRERLVGWNSNALTPLRVIEANWSNKLAMNQFSLAREEGTMVIEFEASSLKEGMDLHRRLVASGYFRGVKLLRHSIGASAGASVVLLAIELQWDSVK